jgi:hypothetical protein
MLFGDSRSDSPRFDGRDDDEDDDAMWAALTVTERGGSHGSQRPIHLPRAVLSLSPLAVRFRIVGDPAGTVVSIYYEDVASIAVLPELGQLVIGTGEPELLTGGREYIVSVRDAALSRQLGDVIEFKAVEHRAMRHERRDRQLWRSATMRLPKSRQRPPRVVSTVFVVCGRRIAGAALG